MRDAGRCAVVVLVAVLCAAGAEAAQSDHLATQLSRSVLAGQVPKQGVPQLDTALNSLLAQWSQDPTGAAARAIQRGLKLDEDRVHVTLRMLDEDAAESALVQIPKLGGEVTAHFKQAIDAWVPILRLGDLAALPRVSLVHQPIPPIELEPQATVSFIENTLSGSFLTQGVAASNADTWQGEGFSGSGVNVAVIDSFKDRAAAQSAGELPGSISCYPNCASLDTASRHGTACAEIIHDMAPLAHLTLSSASTATEFAQTVVGLAADGQDVISVSMLFPDVVPGDGTGPMADAVHTATNTHGATVAIAAGNHAEYHWDGAFSDSDGDSYHEFLSGTEVNLVSPTGLPALTTVAVYLRWNAWPVTNQDFDLKLYYWDGVGWVYWAGSLNPQTGSQPPWEFFQTVVPFTAYYALVVEKYSASTNPVLDLMVLTRQELDIHKTIRSLTEPATSPASLAVTAIDVGTFNRESYSSRGPTHGPGGSLGGGWEQPRLAAFANVDTWSYGLGSFNGTSAAAPHVAGAAALVRSANPSWTPGQVQSFLENRSVDQGATGWDASFGEGRLWLGNPPCPAPSAPVLAAPASAASGEAYSVTWSATSPDASYVLQEDTDAAFSSPSEFVVMGTSRLFSHTVGTDTDFYYRALAVNECPGADSTSAWSNVDQTSVEAVLYALSVAKVGTGSGTVTSSPSGIQCGGDCDHDYALGTGVGLTGTPVIGSELTSWTGHSDCSDGALTMDGARSCTATFNTCGSQSESTLENTEVTSEQVVSACNFVYVGPNVQVTDTGVLEIYAGNGVTFYDGFETQDGGEMMVVLGQPMPSGPPPPTVVLYSQTGGATGSGNSSQEFETPIANYDSMAADDFTVPPASGWSITEVSVPGFYLEGTLGPTPLVNVEFLTDSPGLPGAVECSYVGLEAGTHFTDSTGSLAIVLPTTCSLPPGRHWVMVQADMDFDPNGQWYWSGRNFPVNSAFAWKNPGDGFGTGCTVWTTGTSCGLTDPDLLFELRGYSLP